MGTSAEGWMAEGDGGMGSESAGRAGRAALLTVLLVGQFMANIDTAIVNIAAPSVQADLHASAGQVDLVVSGYILAYAVLLVTGARLGDTHGHRRIFLLGLLGFVITSLACGIAPEPVTLIVSRLCQGASSALMVPQVLSGIQLHFTGQARVRAIGYYTLALSGGAIVGQVLGGLLVSADILGSGWRPVFLINVPIGAVLLLAGLRALPPDAVTQRQPLDLHGVCALSSAVSLAVVPLVFGRDQGWPVWSWLCLVASAPAFVWFVVVERRLGAAGGRPLVRLDVVARPPVRWALIAHGLTTLTYLALLFVLALYLQHGLGQSPARAGLAMVSWVAAFGIAGPVLPRLPQHTQRFMASAGCLLLAVGYAAVSTSVALGREDGVLLLVLLGLGGLGLGISSHSLISHLTNAVERRYATDLSGVISTNAQLAGTVGVAVFGTLYSGLAPAPGASAATEAFTTVTAVFAVLALISAGAALRATRHADAAPRGDGTQHAVAKAGRRDDSWRISH
ncbi:probable actinorhodin transporter [Streptomyces himastatinicus ATCC 53653]|uniref:Probable actinorhodin transporter n=2 Tax=Streptomyces violaceusniger group TaxID=2839105 RepID=D9WL96_9ACTN|nr:probable actinorhodin transporter [Streptomyces himastatinicus ATCC 53653]